MKSFTSIRRLFALALLAGLTGCTIRPAGEHEERDAAFQAGKPFDKRFDVRQIPSLPDNPTPDQLVEYALLSNAELEQHYWEWRAEIEQIPQDGSQSTTLNVSAGTSITHRRDSWGTSTVAVSNDPMTDIKWPGKWDAAAKQTLENARAAGHRFIKAKFDIRNKVLSAYYDYALNAELIRLEKSDQQLLKTTATVTEAQNRAGRSGQQDVLRAENEVDLSANDIASMESQLVGQRTAINALLSRPAYAELSVPNELTPPRALTYSDTELVELTARQNPELTALADEIHGRDDGIRLAKLQYVPDFNLSAGTDLMGITQSLLGQATVPFLRSEAINAAIAQGEANLHAAEAMRRQAANDLTAQVITDIAVIHDADRQVELLEQSVLPHAKQITNVGRAAYESGHATLLDLLDDQRSLNAIERLIANVKIIREKHLVDLETIAASNLSAAHG